MRNKPVPFYKYLLRFSLATLFCFLILLSFLYYFKIHTFTQDIKESTIQLRMNQISNELESEFNDVYHTFYNLKNNEMVLSYIDELEGAELSPSAKYRQLSNLENYLDTFRHSSKLIDNILIITPTTQYSSDHKYVDFLFNGMQLKPEVESSFYFINKGEANNKIWLPSSDVKDDKDRYNSSNLNNEIFFGGNLTSHDGTHKGVILVFLNPAVLGELVFYADQIHLLDKNGAIIYRGENVDGLSKLQHGEIKLNNLRENGMIVRNDDIGVFYSTVPHYQFQLIYEESLLFYKRQIWLMIRNIVITSIVAGLLTYILSRIVGRRILKPLHQLISSIKRYESNQDYKSLLQGKINRNISISLRDRFFFYLIITVMVPLVIYFLMLYGQTSKLISEDLRQSNFSVHEKTARLVSNEITDRETTIARISLNNEIKRYLLENDFDKLRQELINNEQYYKLRNYNVRIYNEQGVLIFGQEENSSPSFLKEIEESKHKITYTIVTDYFDQKNIILGMPILSSNDYKDVIGFITVDIVSNELADIFSESERTDLNFMLINKSNVILSHPTPDEIGNIVQKESLLNQNSRDQFVKLTALPNLDWEFLSISNYQDIQKEVYQLFISDLYIFLMILLFLLFLAYWFSKRISRSFDYLNQLMETFDLKGIHDHLLGKKLSGFEEVDFLSNNFNQMIVRLEGLMNESIESNQERIKLEYEKRDLQLNALQSQVNPHFLYNTLDNLIYLVEARSTDKAVDMIASLSNFFRFITNRERNLISLRDEITYAKTYVKIMTYRFENFECIWDIDEDILDCKTIKLIIQPLIENAINHGVRKTRKTVVITVSCKRYNDEIWIRVSDNANGIRREELLLIKDQIEKTSLTKSGIYNVNARIRLHYGDAYGLSIESEPEIGTNAIIKFPIQKSNNN
nr:histidine kinase [Fredinandcohnia onubensis]